MDRQSFLQKLDTYVWVEKRLFPARLLILDEIESIDKSEKFVISIINTLFSTKKDKRYLNKSLAEVALIVAQELKDVSPHSSSILEQFLSDLNTFGLREALAYLFEYPGYNVSDALANSMAKGYTDIGKRFLKHSNIIKKSLQERYSRFIKSKGNSLSNILDKLIVVDAISFNGVWKDGQHQTNLAI